jgi:hypothetical protein
MNDRIIGHRLFVDGSTRAVYLDAAGKQYVGDADDERVAMRTIGNPVGGTLHP